MADQLYNIKVKNTFLEVDVDDDELLDLSLDEDEGPKRQVTEPVPPTTRLLDIHPFWNMPRQKTMVQSASSHNNDSDTSSEHDHKATDSTASSEHDRKATEPFQPECEPELTYDDEPELMYDGSEMPRQVTEELWSDKRWEPDMELSCISPNRAVAGQYTFEPYMHTMTTGALIDHEETENISTHRSSSQQKGKDSVRSKEKGPRRRKRESLIDVAARKQKQELRKANKQAKYPSQEQLGRQPSSSSQQSKSVRGDVPKSNFAKFCRQCGNGVQLDYKFCRFCGFNVS